MATNLTPSDDTEAARTVAAIVDTLEMMREQAVRVRLLELAQRRGQHLLGYAADGAPQLAEAHCAAAEFAHHQDRPFVADPLQDVAHRPAVLGAVEHDFVAEEDQATNEHNPLGAELTTGGTGTPAA